MGVTELSAAVAGVRVVRTTAPVMVEASTAVRLVLMMRLLRTDVLLVANLITSIVAIVPPTTEIVGGTIYACELRGSSASPIKPQQYVA